MRPITWQPDAVPYNKTRLIKEQNMPNDLFDQIFRSTIGFDPLKNYVSTATFNNYPPFNIFKTSILDEERNHMDPAYRLELAVAGFKKDEIQVYIEDGLLVIKGHILSANERDPNTYDIEHEYLYRGLSFRDFERTFQLGKNVEVVAVNLSDGLLNIDLKETRPDVNRKTFDIK
jgi:molecular chaperone IbpA